MITLLNESCLKTMAEMPDGIVDLIVTDPAYKVISGGNSPKTGRRTSGILTANDGKIFAKNNIKPSEYIPEFYRVLKDPAHLYLMTNFYNLEEMLRELRKAKFNIHNLLVWKKNNVTPNRYYMKNIEYTILARKGRAFSINNKGSKTCVEFDNPKSPKLHPTEKPVGLMELYVGNSSQEGDIVYDPFVGSGATGVACQNLKRNFIGSELDIEHFRVCEERLLI